MTKKLHFRRTVKYTAFGLMAIALGIAINTHVRPAVAATVPDACFTTSGTTELTITSYNTAGTGCTLTPSIPSSIGGIPVTIIGTNSMNSRGLTAIEIPNGVTTIEANAFDLNQLTSVVIPNTVTSLGWNAFLGNQLASVTLSNQLTTIPDRVFQSNKLTSVTIPGSVTTIQSAAFAYNGIQTVTIPDSVTTLDGSAFDFQSSLMKDGKAELDSHDTARVTAFLNQIWYARVYTASPSNPNSLVSSYTNESQAFDGDINGDGDETDSLGGHLINPAKITLRYQDGAGATLRADDTLTGTGLTNYLVSVNTANDLGIYYTLGSSDTFTPPAIAKYREPAPVTLTLATQSNTHTFAYQGPIPTLVSLNPANNTQDVLLRPAMQVTFDRAVYLCEGECAVSLMRLGGGGDAIASWWPGAEGFSGNNTTTLTFELPADVTLDPSTTYYLIAGDITSTDGNVYYNEINTKTSWRFTTGDGDIISAAVEDAAPNSGDGNNDGTSDSLQQNVTSFVSPVTGNYVTIEVPNTCALTRSSVIAESSNSTQDNSYSYPLGLADFSAQCDTPGFSATVKLYFHGANTGTYTARKFLSGTYATIAGAQLTTATIGGKSATVLSYTAQDGNTATDSDGMANGIIVDPAGLGVVQAATTTASTGPLANTGQKILAVFFAATALITLSSIIHTRTKQPR